MSLKTGPTADEMSRAQALPQLDARSLIDGERLEAEIKDMYRHVALGEETELHFEVGRGLVHEAAGERASAMAWLRDSTVRAVRLADPYVWMHAYCLEALADVAIADAAPDAAACVARLERLAARGDMRELVVRAALHRARLGDPSGVEAARLLGEAIDNAALHAELAAAV